MTRDEMAGNTIIYKQTNLNSKQTVLAHNVFTRFNLNFIIITWCHAFFFYVRDFLERQKQNVIFTYKKKKQ